MAQQRPTLRFWRRNSNLTSGHDARDRLCPLLPHLRRYLDLSAGGLQLSQGGTQLFTLSAACEDTARKSVYFIKLFLLTSVLFI